MELYYEKLDKNLYVLDDFFTMDEFMPLHDELHGMYHTFLRKRERYMGGENPYWFALSKNDTPNSSPNNGLGENMVFLDRATKIRWAINKILRPDFSFYLKRINTNLQWKFQDSSFHLDSYSNELDEKYWGWTFLACTQTDWDYEWGGEFVCQVADRTYKNISYSPNRCILFNGDCSHRGAAPNIFARDVRTTVAWTFVSVDAHITPDATSYIP
ncbi:hypothetical protein Syn7803US36_204 [Synechococcus phage ACG-2014f]|uniref:Prolyl 4-hydroxylase alpha subunit Fe(2+) 2OG dioxygenase domain-containing protein n=1 Tax=Synechococcus phage ACG-2014f TaxID=1493511 RepID=A0A0E3HK97_9CAUD|nr:hypothetical protein Syn7803US36_204 [Synechococcus phage ACG-2014f]AIX32403.1 hypothetical protein Syn7803US44_203 [Synechococcus phage ACG-2014f]